MVASASVTCDIIAVSAFIVFSKNYPNLTPDIKRILKGDSTYLVNSYDMIAFWVAILLIFAVTLGAIGACIGKLVRPHESTMSAWWMLFDKWDKEGHSIYIACSLDDNSWIEGTVNSFNQASDETGDREIVLFGPIRYAYEKTEDTIQYPMGAACISSSRIVTMFVSYLPRDTSNSITSREISASVAAQATDSP